MVYPPLVRAKYDSDIQSNRIDAALRSAMLETMSVLTGPLKDIEAKGCVVQ